MQKILSVKAIGKFESIDPVFLEDFPEGVIGTDYGKLQTKNEIGKKVFWEKGTILALQTFRHGKIRIFHDESNFKKYITAQPTFKSVCLDWAESVGFAMFWFAVISTWLFCSFVVPTKSMVPNLVVGDKLFGLKASYYFSDPPRGSMVIFEPPAEVKRLDGELWVKRVIAGPGDNVSIDGGSVYVNGEKLPETYTTGKKTSSYSGEYNEGFHDGPKMKEVRREWKIPKKGEEGSGWFVLGDNRENSFDSRSFGPIPDNNIRGRPWFIWSPFSRMGTVPNLYTDD